MKLASVSRIAIVPFRVIGLCSVAMHSLSSLIFILRHCFVIILCHFLSSCHHFSVVIILRDYVISLCRRVIISLPASSSFVIIHSQGYFLSSGHNLSLSSSFSVSSIILRCSRSTSVSFFSESLSSSFSVSSIILRCSRSTSVSFFSEPFFSLISSAGNDLPGLLQISYVFLVRLPEGHIYTILNNIHEGGHFGSRNRKRD